MKWIIAGVACVLFASPVSAKTPQPTGKASREAWEVTTVAGKKIFRRKKPLDISGVDHRPQLRFSFDRTRTVYRAPTIAAPGLTRRILLSTRARPF